MKRYLLFVLIAAILCAGCSADESKTNESDNDNATVEATQTPGGESHTEPLGVDSTAPTEPTGVAKGDYILDGTKLIGYIGEDTELTLPGEVTSIAAYAFCNSPTAAQITAVHLGANVTEVEVGAFTGMHSLTTFTVDPQNPRFYSYEDHTLVSLDGTLYIGLGIDFQDIISSLESKWIENFAIADKIIIGGGEIFVYHKSDKLFASSVCANGQNVVFGESIQITGNHDIYIQETKQGYIFSDKYNHMADIWLLTENHIFEFENGLTEEQRNEHKLHQIADYNYSLYTLFAREDGTLGYYRILSKYTDNNQYVYGGLLYCISRDEFACEVGSVELKGSSLDFKCEKVFTAEERYSDAFFETIYIHGSNYSLEEQFLLYLKYESNKFATLDELLAANAEKYERGY